jgi:hypothetical protein
MATALTGFETGGAGLPIPKVKLTQDRDAGPPAVSVFSRVAGTTITATVRRTIEVIAPNLPQALLDPTVGLQLELLRYRSQGNGGRSKKGQRGYVHPSTFGAADGGATHSGRHNVDPSIEPLRVTEWKITQQAERVDVTQALAAWLEYISLFYHTASGLAKIILPCPASRRNAFSFLPTSRRFCYAPVFCPAYFAFRYSILDPQDSRNRIVGAMSPIVTLTTQTFPFVPDPDQIAIQQREVSLVSEYDHTQLAAWIGPTSRLPTPQVLSAT